MLLSVSALRDVLPTHESSTLCHAALPLPFLPLDHRDNLVWGPGPRLSIVRNCLQLLEGARLSTRQQEAIKAVRRRYLGEVAVLAGRRDELEAVLQQVGL